MQLTVLFLTQASRIDLGEQIILLNLFQQICVVTEVLSEIKPLKNERIQVSAKRGFLPTTQKLSFSKMYFSEYFPC